MEVPEMEIPFEYVNSMDQQLEQNSQLTTKKIRVKTFDHIGFNVDRSTVNIKMYRWAINPGLSRHLVCYITCRYSLGLLICLNMIKTLVKSSIRPRPSTSGVTILLVLQSSYFFI